jgi:hypothetical protein
MDLVTIQRGEKAIELKGEILVEAQNGDLMLRACNGRIWMIEASEIVAQQKSAAEFTGLSADEIEAELLQEFPEGFEIYQTRHYVICYSTSDAYAKWVGALYERLHSAFTNFWSRRGFEIYDADTPQVVLIFDTRENYARYANNELGTDPGGMVAYYNLENNRVVMYDLTGADAFNRENDRRHTTAQINTILNQPYAAAMVATIVHEATHQLAFNCGLQTRFADWPFWVSEGLAMYFETPSLKSSRGWSGLGHVNRMRLVQMRAYLSKRPADSLTTLISDDKRFRDPELMLDAYAEAWSLNYFLFHKHSKELDAYLQAIGEKKPLFELSAEERIADFKQHFGDDLQQLDEEFLNYIRSLK